MNKWVIWFIKSCTGSATFPKVENTWIIWLATNPKNGKSYISQEVLLLTKQWKLFTHPPLDKFYFMCYFIENVTPLMKSNNF